VHSTDGSLYALDANNGSQRWKVHVGPNNGASPAVSSSRVHVVTGADVIAIAPSTGARLWTRSLADAGDLTTPVASGSDVYVGSGPTAAVHALTASTGVVRWTRTLSEAGPASVSSLVVGEGVVYAQTASALHAVNAADGVPRFTRAGAGAASAGQSFALANHVLYLPGPRALNGSTGALLWSGGDGAGSPSVADGVLYAGASAFRLP
jgi:outer membrane protein assembly factor BamB